MKVQKNTLLSALGALVIAGAGATSAAKAEDFGLPGEFEAEVTFVSDYIFRGVSMSDEDPAIQGGLTWGHESGFYAGIWGSSGKFDNGNVEFDYFVGYGTEVNGVSFDVSVIYYTYPGDGVSGNYWEFMGTVGYDLGLAAITAGVGYVPSGQTAFDGSDAVYLFSELEVPVPNTPLTAAFHLGYEDFGGGDNKWDWSAGLYAHIWGLDWGVAYHDTDVSGDPAASSRVVFSVSKTF